MSPLARNCVNSIPLNNGTQGPLQKPNHDRRNYFSTIFHWTLIARGPDSAARPDYFETMHSISVILYALNQLLNCRSRKRSVGVKLSRSYVEQSTWFTSDRTTHRFIATDLQIFLLLSVIWQSWSSQEARNLLLARIQTLSLAGVEKREVSLSLC